MKHFAKKIAQKTSIESPSDAFITKYTENIQKVNRVKNEATDIIFDAELREKTEQRAQKSIRPPSREASGMRLNRVRQSEIIEKGSKNPSLSELIAFNEWGRVSKNPKNPANGPPEARRNSFL
jgi:hypothetical protein